MKIAVDAYVQTAHGKSVCQDYVMAEHDPVPLLIVADGCSTGKDTDIGARVGQAVSPVGWGDEVPPTERPEDD